MCGLVLGAAALLAACASDADLRQPLSGPAIRMDIAGRTFTGLAGDQRFFITFGRNGTARYVGAVAEYVHWRAGPDGLCIRWYDAAAEACAPVHRLGYASYRVGTITMTELSGPKRFWFPFPTSVPPSSSSFRPERSGEPEPRSHENRISAFAGMTGREIEPLE